MNALDLLSGVAMKVTAIVTLVIATVGVLDNRHAKASDFKQLVSIRYVERIERIEEKITETEDTINRIELKTKLTDSEKLHLNQLRDRKAKYLRKLEAVNPR